MPQSRLLMHIGVGIDTGRYGHHVSFLGEDRQPAAADLPIQESRVGYEQLRKRLYQLHAEHPQAHFHVRIDAAGQYATNLETFLRSLSLPITLSIGEPKRNRDYRQAHFAKRKADPVESLAMARFAVVERPAETFPVPEPFRVLREVAGRLQSASRDATRAANRWANLLARVFPELALLFPNLAAQWLVKLLAKYPTPQKMARASLSSLCQIPYVTREKAEKIQAAARDSVASQYGPTTELLVQETARSVREAQGTKLRLEKLLLSTYHQLSEGPYHLLETIDGIGDVTAAVLTAKIVDITRFAAPGRLVGYFGTFPEEDDSGMDKLGQPKRKQNKHMSRKGNDLVRAYLWNAALTAKRVNPAIRALYHRLRARGVRHDVALGYCMAKLLHLVFAIWTSGQPFDPDHYPWEAPPEEEEPAEEAAPAGSAEVVLAASRGTKKAAGHKRDILPVNKLVTAANSNVESPPPSVKPQEIVATTRAVNFAALRQQITLEQVLQRLGHFHGLRGTGPQRRGTCPIHDPQGTQKRTFSVHLEKNVFRCFYAGCRAQGNALDLWAAVHRQSIHAAALHIAEVLQLPRTEKRNP